MSPSPKPSTSSTLPSQRNKVKRASRACCQFFCTEPVDTQKDADYDSDNSVADNKYCPSDSTENSTPEGKIHRRKAGKYTNGCITLFDHLCFIDHQKFSHAARCIAVGMLVNTVSSEKKIYTPIFTLHIHTSFL